MFYRPRFWRWNPANLVNGYRGFNEGSGVGDGMGMGPGGPGGFGPGGGFGGGLGSFIFGGIAGAVLANIFDSKHTQSSQQVTPTSSQPVVHPVPVTQPMPYMYVPYGYAPQMSQVPSSSSQASQETSEVKEEENYPDFDEWKGKQPVKETHHVYTIPTTSVYPQPMPYQVPMYNTMNMSNYQMVQPIIMNQSVPQSMATSYQVSSATRPATMVMPYYMFPVQPK
ncbi:MAG: hypothetical protein K2G70_02090 [Turicibacter sp.]|nr:hypothetical protein [Turicibacter sp.]